MPGQKTPEDGKASLQQAVEILARQVVLNDGDGWDEPELSARQSEEIAASLREISVSAGESGCSEMAGIAAELLKADASGEQLAEGIRRLQESLATPTQETAEASGSPADVASLGEDPELLADFVLESREHLANIENQLLELERNPGSHDSLHSTFRGFHTIKGLAGFLDLEMIHAVAHEVETVLDLARNGELSMSPDVIDVVLAGADNLKAAMRAVEDGLKGKASSPPDGTEQLLVRVRAIANSGEKADVALAQPSENEPPPIEQAASVAEAAGKGTQSVKVNTGKLDQLVDMVGELVVAQSLLRHDPKMATIESTRLQRNLSQLSRITTDVQRAAMSMRMVPVGNLFRRMARLVRDLSRKEGKQIEFVTSGDDTELDRNIVEELADPLMHMVRNAVGHGLETIRERVAAGKSAQGTVSLSAYHQSGFIVIELADDGRGLHRDKILRRARERGLVADGADLTDHDVNSLLFEPGFSTATEVNDVSGRGVGMDVVKRNIMKLRGRVDIHSVEGLGTTFSLKVPLTLAIIEGLIVGVGSERYIVPIYTVREMLRPAAEAISTFENREEMVMVRGRLLPVVRLYRRFGLEPRSENPTESLLLVTENLGKSFCLMVDELIGKQEVVIKSLGEMLKNVSGVAGGAILGDGHVGLILDMDGLFGVRTNG